MHLRARTDRLRSEIGTLEHRLLVGRKVTRVDRWIGSLFLVRELAELESLGREHFTNLDQTRLAKVLARKQFRFAGASQVTDGLDAHFRQAVAASNTEFKVRDGHVERLRETIVAALHLFVVQHVAVGRRILHVQLRALVVGVRVKNSLVAHLCLVEFVAVLVDQSEIDQGTHARRERFRSPFVQA